MARKRKRPSLAVWKFASCDGCQLTVLNLEDELLTLADELETATSADERDAFFDCLALRRTEQVRDLFVADHDVEDLDVGHAHPVLLEREARARAAFRSDSE